MVLDRIKKVLFSEENFSNCLWCGVNLIGKQRKFCSDKCNNYHYRYVEKFGNNPSSSYSAIRSRYLCRWDKKQRGKMKVRKDSYNKYNKSNINYPCFFCGRESKETHHNNYDGSEEDEYRLCKWCHKQLHIILNRLKGGLKTC